MSCLAGTSWASSDTFWGTGLGAGSSAQQPAHVSSSNCGQRNNPGKYMKYEHWQVYKELIQMLHAERRPYSSLMVPHWRTKDGGGGGGGAV